MEVENKKDPTLQKLYLGITVIILLIIIFLVNFLGIINIPFLPTLQPTPKITVQTKTPSAGHQVSISVVGKDIASCPLTSSICQKGVLISTINQQSVFYGLGYTNLPANTPVKAATSGTLDVEQQSLNGVNVTVITIRNSEQQMSANYFMDLTGYLPSKTTVKQGDIIGYTNNKTVSFLGKNYSFFFYLAGSDKPSSTAYKIKPSQGGSSLDNIL
jgi:hypothetical protein